MRCSSFIALSVGQIYILIQIFYYLCEFTATVSFWDPFYLRTEGLPTTFIFKLCAILVPLLRALDRFRSFWKSFPFLCASTATVLFVTHSTSVQKVNQASFMSNGTRILGIFSVMHRYSRCGHFHRSWSIQSRFTFQLWPEQLADRIMMHIAHFFH